MTFIFSSPAIECHTYHISCMSRLILCEFPFMVASSYVGMYGVAAPVIEMIQLIVIGRNHVKLI